MFISRFWGKLSVLQVVVLGLLPSVLFSLFFLTWFLRESKVKTQRAEASDGKVVMPRDISPVGTPDIQAIEPFFGKEGDEVLIRGSNFGYYPKGATISIEGTPVFDYTEWIDKEIVFKIPRGAKSGFIRVEFNGFSVTWDKIFTVYYPSTVSSVELDGNALRLKGFGEDIGRVRVWNSYRGQPIVFLVNQDNAGEQLINLDNKPVWVEILDRQDKPIPFFVY